jgi:formyltetrahydrofolate hydrolase
MKNTAILLINCPDRKSIILAIASFLYEHGANIIHADQHRDNPLGLFFMRVQWALEDFDLDKPSFREKFARWLCGSVALIVLARYMQLLSVGFVAKYPRKIINVHHSFLHS